MGSPAAPPRVGFDLYEHAVRQVDTTAALMGLDEDMHQVLRTPKRILSVQVRFEVGDGDQEVLTGYRVQHNINRGPAIGGLRYDADATVGEVVALAMLMTWKCGLIGLPFGGSAGAVVCDPGQYTPRELERLTRRYATETAILIGPSSDIVAPDLHTDSQIMAWIMDTYSMHQGFSVPNVVTGKPVSLGGSEGSQDATGRGLVYLLNQVAGRYGIDPTSCAVAVQGFGNVGSVVASLLHAAGCKVVAVSEAAGGLYNAAGLDIPRLLEYRAGSGQIAGFAEADVLSNAELLTCPCDILVPAAVQNQITVANASAVQARLVVEGANGPTTEEADAILKERGVPVLPDILAGAGGVTVAYFEWVQGLQETFWSESEVHARLVGALQDALDTVSATAERLGVSYRSAAYVKGMGAVAQATELRGIYP
ncbi:MAG: Glu/Leu/Phe/Val family dehydrogenase [Chloroflexota bacterium]